MASKVCWHVYVVVLPSRSIDIRASHWAERPTPRQAQVFGAIHRKARGGPVLSVPSMPRC
jgi:hypothetical protein